MGTRWWWYDWYRSFFRDADKEYDDDGADGGGDDNNYSSCTMTLTRIVDGGRTRDGAALSYTVRKISGHSQHSINLLTSKGLAVKKMSNTDESPVRHRPRAVPEPMRPYRNVSKHGIVHLGLLVLHAAVVLPPTFDGFVHHSFVSPDLVKTTRDENGGYGSVGRRIPVVGPNAA